MFSASLAIPLSDLYFHQNDKNYHVDRLKREGFKTD